MCVPLILLTSVADSTGIDGDKHEIGPVPIIIFLVVVCLIVLWAWPSLKENSIFSEKRIYNYGTSEQVVKKNKSAAINLLIAIFVLAYGSVVVMFFSYIHNNGANFIIPIGAFSFSFAGLVAAYIYTFIDLESFSAVSNFSFIIKTWLTTIVAAPAVLVLMDMHRIKSFNTFYSIYANTVRFGHNLGIVTFTVLLFAVNDISKLQWTVRKKRLYILLITEAALWVNMYVIAIIMDSGTKWLLEILPYTIIIAICIWFYPMDNTVYSEVIEAEVID